MQFFFCKQFHLHGNKCVSFHTSMNTHNTPQDTTPAHPNLLQSMLHILPAANWKANFLYFLRVPRVFLCGNNCFCARENMKKVCAIFCCFSFDIFAPRFYWRRQYTLRWTSVCVCGMRNTCMKRREKPNRSVSELFNIDFIEVQVQMLNLNSYDSVIFKEFLMKLGFVSIYNKYASDFAAMCCVGWVGFMVMTEK